MSNWQTGEHFMRKYTEDEKFMKEAIKQAKKAETIGDVPIGCYCP